MIQDHGRIWAQYPKNRWDSAGFAPYVGIAPTSPSGTAPFATNGKQVSPSGNIHVTSTKARFVDARSRIGCGKVKQIEHRGKNSLAEYGMMALDCVMSSQLSLTILLAEIFFYFYFFARTSIRWSRWEKKKRNSPSASLNIYRGYQSFHLMRGRYPWERFRTTNGGSPAASCSERDGALQRCSFPSGRQLWWMTSVRALCQVVHLLADSSGGLWGQERKRMISTGGLQLKKIRVQGNGKVSLSKDRHPCFIKNEMTFSSLSDHTEVRLTFHFLKLTDISVICRVLMNGVSFSDRKQIEKQITLASFLNCFDRRFLERRMQTARGQLHVWK